MKTFSKDCLIVLGLWFLMSAGCDARESTHTTVSSGSPLENMNGPDSPASAPSPEEIYAVSDNVSVVSGETDPKEPLKPETDPATEDTAGEVAFKVQA